MKKNPAITVFCGSNDGSDPYSELYIEAALSLGNVLAELRVDLIYGAGDRGLMGRVAKAAREGGSKVIGVNLERFHASGKHRMENDEYIVTKTLQERKEKMISRSDAIIVLPGGIGTLDELMEVLSLRQLGFFDKPIALLNIDNYFGGLLSFFSFMISKGFMREKDLGLFTVSENPRELVTRLLQITLR